MNSSVNIILQSLAVFLQVLNSIDVAKLPPKWQGIVTALLTAGQAAAGIAAHYYTPAGNSISPSTGAVKSATTGETVAHVPTVKQ